MHESVAKALSLTHTVFRPGVPHFRERRLIPIRTAAHLIVFDVDKVSALYTMMHVTPGNREVNVGRKDNFVSGDMTLPDDLCTSEADYAAWNKEHPDKPVDKGHGLGSQMQRSDDLLQSDIDTLAGCQPESDVVNRLVKSKLENAIKARTLEQTQSWLVQGPGWYGSVPVLGKLNSGQWVPDFMWISALFQKGKTVESYAWVMENVWDMAEVDLRTVSLDELDAITGLYLWGNVGADKFQAKRSKASGGDWWREGQPSAK